MITKIELTIQEREHIASYLARWIGHYQAIIDDPDAEKSGVNIPTIMAKLEMEKSILAKIKDAPRGVELTRREFYAAILDQNRCPGQMRPWWLCMDPEFQRELLTEADAQFEQWKKSELKMDKERKAGSPGWRLNDGII